MTYLLDKMILPLPIEKFLKHINALKTMVNAKDVEAALLSL